MSFKLLTVSNKSSRDYPGAFTPEEEQIIKHWCKGRVLHLFCGESDIGDVKIDTKFGFDVFEYLEQNRTEQWGTILLDPPYNQRYADKYAAKGGGNFVMGQRGTKRLFMLITQLRPRRIIIKSWGYYGLEKRGYAMKEGYVCYAGGYRRPTFLLLYELSQTRLDPSL